MNPAALRFALRWLHVALACPVGAYVYSPWAGHPVFAGLVKWVLFPLVGLAGLAMWLQPRWARRLAHGQRAQAHPPATRRPHHGA